ATRLAPEVPETWVATIQFLVSVKKTAEARALLDKAEETIPPDKRDVALALCYEALQLDEEAEAKYKEASEATPDDAILVRHMATFYLRGGKPEEAETQLNRIIDGKLNASKNDVVWARRQLALVLSSRRDYRATQQAIELIRKNVEEGASPEDQRLLAKIQATMPQAANRMLAISALEDLLENQNTESPEDRFALARLYLARGNWEKFSEHMRELLVSHGDQPRYLTAYVDALLKRGLTYEARDRLKRLEAVAPNAVATYVLKARTLAQAEKYDAVIRLMREYVADNKAEPTNSDSRLGQAALILEQVIAQLKTESRRDGVEEKTAVQKTNAAKKLADEAEKLYLRYTQFRRERRIVLAGFYARQSRMADAMAIIEDEWKRADPTALAQALRIVLKSPESTPDLIRRGEKVAQDSLEHHERAFPLLIIMADVRTIHAQYAEAEGYYREILKESSGNTIVLNNLAVLLAIQGKKLDEALKLVNRAIELTGPNSSMLDSRATVYLALKKPEKALAELDRAIKEEDAPTRRLHQAQAYFQLGRKRAAANSLRIAERDGLAAQPLLVSERKTYAALKKQLPK
ncbi:MAG: tetratricopeptide repeat protein, partial [Thermoguttaceae bacterium]